MSQAAVVKFVSKLESVTGKHYSNDQKRAIECGDGPLWITAGPGSGKSEVLVARTIRLLVCDAVKPESIILTTFTERAADNLVNRISNYLDRLGLSDQIDATGLRTGTLHSLCNSIMRDHRYPPYIDLELMDENSRMFFLYNQDDITKHLKDNWKEMRPLFAGSRVSERFGPNRWAATAASAFIFDRITEFRANAEAMKKSKNEAISKLAGVYEDYRARLRDRYRCDFSTLQEYFLQFLDSPHGKEFLQGDEEKGIRPIRHILVDEFQDTNPIQESIYFRIATHKPHNLAVVGDDDQALYRFRGGTVDSLVKFGDRCKREFGTTPELINLNENLRSHPEIVQWFNRYISDTAEMKEKGVRAPGKRDMVAKSPVKGRYPAVCAIWSDRVEESAAKLADFLSALKAGGVISDWRDVGVLFRSTRESPRNAGPYISALRERDIPVYNPRSRALHKDIGIQQLLGTLVAALDKDFETLNAVRGRAKTTVKKWIDAFEALSKTKEGAAVKQYVSKSNEYIQKLRVRENLNTTIMDVLYRILSLSPFHELKENPNHSTRLAEISNLIDAFSAFTEQYGVLRSSSSAASRISFGFLTGFYYQFSGFIEEYGLNEPENQEEVMPSGYVQFMTVHQAKGLEFPVVVVDNLSDQPQIGGDIWVEDLLGEWSLRQPIGTAEDRASQDLIRRFYVAYSRAKNLLILCGKRGTARRWGLGDWNGK